MSDSVWPHRWQPTRLPHPWDSPGKNTGAGCHFLLQCMKLKRESKVTQPCPTLHDPMDCSLPGSSVHGIFQARALEWVAISFSNAWKWKVKVKALSRVWLLATPWTAAYQAPLSMGFSRQECWSGVSSPSSNMLQKKPTKSPLHIGKTTYMKSSSWGQWEKTAEMLRCAVIKKLQIVFENIYNIILWFVWKGKYAKNA